AVLRLTSEDAITLSGGSLSVATASTIDNSLSLSGATLHGDGSLTVNGLFSDNSGTLDSAGGTGQLTAAGGVGLGGNNALTGYCLVIPSGQSASSNATFTLSNGAAIDNYGVFNWACERNFIQGNATTVFNNYGSLVQSTGDPTSSNSLSLPVNNYGSISVQL